MYNLPSDLLERLRAYQVGQGLNSEAEAARRLLDSALQMRDSVKDILKTLYYKYMEERDIRILASEVLTRHSLVTSVQIAEGDVTFVLRNGERGKIDYKGVLRFANIDDSDEYWRLYEISRPEKPLALAQAPKWEPSKGGNDLDDDIPF